jgi:hypothetical protein
MVGWFLAETRVTGLRPTRRDDSDEDVEEEVGGGKIGPGREDIDAEILLMPGVWDVDTSDVDAGTNERSSSRVAARTL